MTLTLKQLQGLQNAPNRTLRKVVETALRLTEQRTKDQQRLQAVLEQRDEANRLAREAQERLAAREMEEQPKFLVVLHRDGYVEVYANEWHPVHIAQMPDLSNCSEAEDYMLSKTPMQYRSLYEQGKRITAGHTAGCMNHTAYKLLQHTLAELELWRRIQAQIANGDETADATEAKAQSASVSQVPAAARSLNDSVERDRAGLSKEVTAAG